MKTSEIKEGCAYISTSRIAGTRIVRRISGGMVEWWVPRGVAPHVMSLRGFARWAVSEAQPAEAGD